MKNRRINPFSILCGVFLTALAADCATFQKAAEIAIDTSELPAGLDAPRMVPGDLNGDGRMDWVFFHGTMFVKAYSHEGDFLWSKINPNGIPNAAPWHPWIPAVWDMNNNGRAEVVTVLQKGGISSTPYLTIIDGETGALLRETALWFTPSGPGNHARRGLISIAYLNSPDEPCIIIGADDVLNQARAYDAELNLLWVHDSGPNTGPNWWIPGDGHYIWPHDLNGDGTDEVFIGKKLYDGQGNLIHELLKGMNDHVDSLVCGDFHPDYPGKEIVICGEVGMRMYNINPETFEFTMIWEIPSGSPVRNPQMLHAGRFDSGFPGVQILAEEKSSETNARFYLIDHAGGIIRSYQSHLSVMPVDVDGDRNKTHIMVDRGVILDKTGAVLVSNAWYAPMPGVYNYSLAMDVLGDPREEILVWNHGKLVIGTNTRELAEEIPSFRGNRSYLRKYSANRYLNRGSRYFDYASALESLAFRRSVFQTSVLYEEREWANARGNLFVGRLPEPDALARRSLLQFDLSALPAQATIVGASLALVLEAKGPMADGGPLPVSLHRVGGAWSEGTSTGSGASGAAAAAGDATWFHSEYAQTSWNVPGGDFAHAPSAVVLVGGETPRLGSVRIEDPAMVGDLRLWQSSPDTNHGWILVGDESVPGAGLEFRGRHGRAETSYPTLTINYTLEALPAWGDRKAVDAGGEYYDADRLGWVNILHAPWVYVHALRAWVYSADPAAGWFWSPGILEE